MGHRDTDMPESMSQTMTRFMSHNLTKKPSRILVSARASATRSELGIIDARPYRFFARHILRATRIGTITNVARWPRAGGGIAPVARLL
jgi:hypothetical protein